MSLLLLDVVVSVLISCVKVCVGAISVVAVTDSVTVVCAGVITLTGLTGLAGLSTLLGFVFVIVQVFDTVDHDVQVGEPYGSEHIEVLDSVIKPS